MSIRHKKFIIPGGIDIYRVLGPYAGLRLLNQVKAVVPLAAYLFLFQVFILRQWEYRFVNNFRNFKRSMTAL